MMIDNYECAGYTFYSKFDSGNLGKVELVRCAEGLGIVGNTVSSVPIGIGTVAGSGSSNVASISGVPIIGSAGTSGGSGVVSNSTIAATTSTSASAIVAATLGVGLHQQHGASGSSASTAGLGLPIPSPTPHATENPLVEIEFNLWTRPDCAGTPYENQNRTWFHFAVTGGRPNQIVKFNVMNLNKQAKLFSQGMHPVTKVGPNGRWERIKDKPSYSITNDVFYISFLHKAPEVGSEQTKIYYAFTFPFTYTELLDQLATFDRKFGRHPFELNKMAYEISQKYDTSSVPAGTTTSTTPTPGDGTKQSSSRRKGKLAKMERVDRTSPESFDETARDGTAIGPPKPSADASESAPPDPTGTAQQKAAKREPSGMVIDENTSESMQQITNLVNKVKIELPQGAGPVASSSSSLSTSSSSKLKLPSFHQQLSSTSNSSVNVVASTSTTGTTTDDDSKGSDQRDEIYYCRELLTHSVEHRRIELLTISSFHGIQTAREPRLRNLFPDEQAQRCHTFRDKKIVFISSRVHPGETPASFVLNGFLSMLLDRKSIVSQTLRRMYVFKVIPFLNPDGVYNGLYRSDTRGHNLNRVYLGPCHETQPAIYAARKLIRYYHLGTDEVEPYELEQEKKSSSPESIHPPAVGVPPNIVNQGESGAAEGTEESTSAVASSTPPTSVGTNAAVAAKKGRQISSIIAGRAPPPASIAAIIGPTNNSTNTNCSQNGTTTTTSTTTTTTTITTNTHNHKAKLPSLMVPCTGAGNTIIPIAPIAVPAKRLAPSSSASSAVLSIEGTRKRRTIQQQQQQRSVIAFTTPAANASPLAQQQKQRPSAAGASSWSDKLFGKILRRRRSKSSGIGKDGKLSPIAQALPRPTLALPPVVEECHNETKHANTTTPHQPCSPLPMASPSPPPPLPTPPDDVATDLTNVSPLTDESDSIEQDTPPASDSGFSEASTSSKVVTMSSISSAGSPVGEPEEGAQQEQTDTTVSVATTDATLSTTNNTTTTTVANPTLAPTKAFTEKLIPELHPIVSEAPPVASVRPAIAARSSSSLSIVSTGSKKSVQAKVDSGKGGKGGFHKQHHSLNKPQFIGVTPTGGGTLKLKDCIIHHHHHHHHHHHALHHHHHHTGASAAAIGSVSGGGGTAGPKLALGSFKKAASKQQQSGQSAATSSCCSSIIGTGAVGGAGVRTATGERGILGETMGGKSRPQTPQTQPSVTIPSATSSLLYGASGSHYRSHRNEYLNPGGGPQRQLNISLDFLTQQLDERSERMVFEDRSNLFMYLDLHGHASKKGVFMYGNHLPSTAEAVECMLLPRLMSLNSQHFHFDACNFSERNMYYKGKRDGLSKEGSGRVAVYKCTGLIKSYTLECNYNTGKCVNILPARGKEIVAKATHTLVPPKYTPGVFEEVGRALGPSILDLTNSNPLSRLPNCEFRTLQGLRNALRIEIERGSSKARVTNKVICCPRAALLFADAFHHHQQQHNHHALLQHQHQHPQQPQGPKGTHAKRLANQLSNSIEISKENAIQWANASNPLVVGGLPGATTCVAAIGTQGMVPANAAASGVAGASAANVVKVMGDELQSASGPSLVAAAAVSVGSTGVGRNTFLKAGSTVSHGKAGKISRKGGAGVFGKKKQKVLCDVSGSVTGAGAAVVTVPGNGKKLQELVLRTAKDQQQQQAQQQQHQVPRKKIKVSGIVGVGSGASIGTTGGPIASGLELCFKGTFGNVVGSSSLPNFLTAVPGAAVVAPSVITAKKVKSESKLLDVDDMQCDDSFDAAPCCSYGTGSAGGTTGGTVTDADLLTLAVAGGSPSLLDVTSATTASSDSSNGGAAGKCRKSNTIGTMTSTSTVGTAKAKKQPKLAKSTKSTGGDASKKLLKKKRSLKSDSTGLKRKKTRIKPALT
uniref:Peptidase M14 domain-containing protein n=1 Tax=Anopheles albimanus TaxID=7167 RepID=A0A182FDX2_ANOAL